MKKLKLLSLFIIISFIQNCKDNSNKVVANTTETNNILHENVDEVIENYVRKLSNSNIQILDSINCSKIEENIEKYEQGISTYGFYSVKSNLMNGIIFGDLNGDGQNDYIANYYCENCYGGGGSGNYLSNCFFITSKNNSIEVNEEMTFEFKKILIDAIKKDFGEEYDGVKAGKEFMINGILFEEIKNQKAYGTFNINTNVCEGSPFPCVEGSFEYDAKNRKLTLVGQISVE